MYEAHFGLKSRPFGSKAEGAGVFVGPEQSKTIAGLNKGLGALDAVVTVTGPVGVGKTTMVSRALEQITPNRMAAWIGRMHLAPDEVLDLLLAGFGIRRETRGTIQRFAAFRRLLAERAAAGAPVAIVVEDAERIGADALVELEALTAADAGDATGANIILMGQPGLNKLLSAPELARMKQRIRLRKTVDALTLPEVQGYLKHVVRQAGGEFDALFDPVITEIVFNCSEGIPRVVNTMCETAMTTAMEEGETRVSVALMHQVAVDAFGYDGPVPAPSKTVAPEITPPAARSEPAQAARETGTTRPAAPAQHAITEKSVEEIERTREEDLPKAARNIVVESGRYPELPSTAVEGLVDGADAAKPVTEAEPPAVDAAPAPLDPPAEATAAETAYAPPVEAAGASPADEDDYEIPELINDTQPELAQLPGTAVPPDDAREARAGAGPKAVEEEAKPAEPVKPPADAGAGDPAGDDEDFDLDAALAVDAGDTNIMKGITPDLDALAAAAAQAEPAPAGPSPDNLPTLSDSMRVDVDREVKRAKAAMAAEAATKPAPAADPAAPKAPQQVDKAVPKAPQEVDNAVPKAAQALDKQAPKAPQAVDKQAPNAPAAVAKDASKAEARKPAAPAPEAPAKPSAANPVKPQPRPAAEPPAKPVTAAAIPEPDAEDFLKPDPELEALAPGGPGKANAAPDDQYFLKPDPDFDALSPDGPESKPAPSGQAAQARPAAPQPSKPAPVAQVSEMTARIAAIDPSKRHSDVDALEAALDAAKKGELDELLQATAGPQSAATPPSEEPEQAESMPEITLDEALAKQTAKNAELEQFASEIAKAKSLEEFSDKMAETLFGNEEFDAIAAAVVANPPQADPGTPADAVEESEPPQIAEDIKLDFEDGADRGPPAKSATPPKNPPAARKPENVELGRESKPSAPAPKAPPPDSIEDQISTSMTETLRALNVAKAADKVAEEKEAQPAKKSGGLFSRFRKSS